MTKPVPAVLARYKEWLHLGREGQWSDGVPDWARNHFGQMDDMTAARAVIEELATALLAMTSTNHKLPRQCERALLFMNNPGLAEEAEQLKTLLKEEHNESSRAD